MTFAVDWALNNNYLSIYLISTVSKIHMAAVEFDGLFNDGVLVVHDENLVATHGAHVAVQTLGGQAGRGVVLQQNMDQSEVLLSPFIRRCPDT